MFCFVMVDPIQGVSVCVERGGPGNLQVVALLPQHDAVRRAV